MPRTTKAWSKRDEDYLAFLYPTYSNYLLSIVFNKSLKAIRSKATRLKLRKTKEHLRKMKAWAGSQSHSNRGKLRW